MREEKRERLRRGGSAVLLSHPAVFTLCTGTCPLHFVYHYHPTTPTRRPHFSPTIDFLCWFTLFSGTVSPPHHFCNFLPKISLDSFTRTHTAHTHTRTLHTHAHALSNGTILVGPTCNSFVSHFPPFLPNGGYYHSSPSCLSLSPLEISFVVPLPIHFYISL